MGAREDRRIADVTRRRSDRSAAARAWNRSLLELRLLVEPLSASVGRAAAADHGRDPVEVAGPHLGLVRVAVQPSASIVNSRSCSRTYALMPSVA